MSWFWVIIFLSLGVNKNNHAEANINHQKVVSSGAAAIVGTVYCDTCFHHYSPRFIAGATIMIECNDPSPGFSHEVKTDKHGGFKVHLPPSIGKHIKNIKSCSVKLITSNHPYCGVTATAVPSSLRPKLRKDGTHIFSAGFFTFKPLKQPQLCDQKPSVNRLKNFPPVSNMDDLSFPPPIEDPPPLGSGYLPPLPRLPSLPPLPRLPPLPGFPFLPPASQVSKNVVDQPMELPLPEIPSFGIPPGFPLPSSPSLVPGLTPSSPTPVPSLPTQPKEPGFPGVPPAEMPKKFRIRSP